MPNWAESNIVITGTVKAIDNIVNTKFDFNKIIPEPKGLALDCDEITCAMCEKPYLKELYKKNGTLKHPNDHHCEDCDVSDNIGGRVHTDDIDSTDLTENEKKLAKQWIKEYGTASWYDWNVAHWNTKWNVNPDDVSIERSTTQPDRITELSAHDTIADQLEVHFSTAWDSPTQIFMKLALDYNVMIKVDVSGEVDKPWSDEYDGVNMVCTLGDQKPRTLSYELIAQFSNDTIEYVNTLQQKLGNDEINAVNTSPATLKALLNQKLGSNRDPNDYLNLEKNNEVKELKYD